MSAVKVKDKKRSILLAVLLVALVCYFIATLISIQSKVKAQEAANLASQQTLQQLNDENADKADRLKNGDESENIEQIAREQYGYADPDERVYYDSTD
ncbi:MAG: septum formation initiator family protein [Clostridia bacterium]|nr:septum formation initiator family protein [Clostridia bacterium]